MSRYLHGLRILATSCLGLLPAISFGQTFATDFEQLLTTGKLTAAIDLAAARVKDAPEDAQARFSEGIAEFLFAVEGLGQGLHRYGLRNSYDNEMLGFINLPFLRLPVPENPTPEEVTYDGLRQVLAQFHDRLAIAEATLAQVPDQQIDLPLHLMEIRLDLNSDGLASADESIGGALYRIAVGQSPTADDQIGTREILAIDFDQSDVPWLRGYCHLLMAMADLPLAYDWHRAFDLTFHNLFPKSHLASHELAEQSTLAFEYLRTAPKYFDYPEFNWDFLPDEGSMAFSKRWNAYKQGRDTAKAAWDKSPAAKAYAAAQGRIRQMTDALWMGGIADSIAFIHVLDWPVVQPDRMKEARQHLLQMISLSRENWRRIKAETDDKVEWLPGPKQTSLMENLRVTASRVQGWGIFLDEFEAVLNGKKLIPHWRVATKRRGINLRRLFDEPAALDLVLLLQGSAALPYLEDGETVQTSTVDTVFNLMGSGLIGYFFWFN
ncbi:MAG: Uncharacterized protein FD162_3421 [Rhodobacteraceae bacterium]|uniref:hypothetical protein n=1 Tax=Cypionkella sp. TaxID=2811411 RepID=UPI001328427A|nr:hypothetical protein [Cypionkella sp.]KAF0170703.1 MAG: Uncharacterized protein FD162_3421 [Paracoccaceae bacterium]MDO8326501.1 hypothetical protein [Cypionkella sp.]